jgi:hypothetical protein
VGQPDFNALHYAYVQFLKTGHEKQALLGGPVAKGAIGVGKAIQRGAAGLASNVIMHPIPYAAAGTGLYALAQVLKGAKKGAGKQLDNPYAVMPPPSAEGW